SGAATDTPKPAASAAATTAASTGGATSGTPAVAAAASPKPATASKGELKIALGFDFPAKIDALKDTHLSPYGMLESLMFQTPQTSAIFPYALTLTSTAIHKPSTPGSADAAIMTGPYKPTKLVVDNELDLEPFAGHWGGTPPIAKITMRFVGDPNARILALQS